MTSTTESSVFSTPRVAAGALFLDDGGRILLLRPSYKPHWDIPGGYSGVGESPRAACGREIYEELGLRVRIGQLLSVDWAPSPDEGDKILFIFDAHPLTDEQLRSIEFRDGEIAEYRFVSPADLDQFTIPRLSRRLHSTLAAHAHHRATYLEDGEFAVSG